MTVHVGDVLEIRLPENAAAGYRWTISSLDSTHITVLGQDYEKAGGAGVGSAGTAVLKLTPKRPSAATRIELTKARSWEPAESASQRFSVDLEVLA